MALILSAASALAHGELKKGDPIDVRLAERLSSEENKTGDTFEALLDEPLSADGQLLAPEGSLVRGELLEVKESGEVKGRALIRMTLKNLTVEDTTYPLDTNEIEVRAEGSKKEDATIIGGGAGIGAVLGAIIGGKKGALIGAAIGAGAGTTAVLVTEGEQVEFEPEQRFRFFVEKELRLPEAGDQPTRDEGRFERPEDEVERGREKDIEEALQALRQASSTSLREARELLERPSETSLEYYFAVASFDSGVDRFQELREDGNKGRLQGVKKLLMQQFEIADAVLREGTIARGLWDAWGQVRAGAQRLDTAYEAERSIGSGHEDSSGRLRWRGRVDGSDRIILRGSDVTTRHLDGRLPEDTSTTLSSPLPRSAVDIELRRIEGRGSIRLTERPSRWNDYQAVVLIEDERGGADIYEFELVWERRR